MLPVGTEADTVIRDAGVDGVLFAINPYLYSCRLSVLDHIRQQLLNRTVQHHPHTFAQNKFLFRVTYVDSDPELLLEMVSEPY